MTLDDLLKAAKLVPMTSQDREAQCHSFVYGNLKIENDAITPEIVEEAARDLDRRRGE